MRATLFGLTALLVSGIAVPVLAAPSGRIGAVKSRMAEMHARDPQGFAACQALAAHEDTGSPSQTTTNMWSS